MGFLFFTLLMLPAMLLYVLFAALIGPFLPVLRPFLDWISQPVVFYTACKILFVAELLLFMALMAVRARRQQDGRLELGYIHSVRGWKRLWRYLVKLTLSWGPFWSLVWAAVFFLCILIEPAGPVP